jgi:hypothetical protein
MFTPTQDAIEVDDEAREEHPCEESRHCRPQSAPVSSRRPRSSEQGAGKR